MRRQIVSSVSTTIQLAAVPLQPITSTRASASNLAASRILLSSNCPRAWSWSEISVTVKREKCAETPGSSLTIALVSGSSNVLEEGVSMPRRMRCFMMNGLLESGVPRVRAGRMKDG